MNSRDSFKGSLFLFIEVRREVARSVGTFYPQIFHKLEYQDGPPGCQFSECHACALNLSTCGIIGDMKFILLALVGLTINALAQDSCLFTRPLIIGASVSAGFGANKGGPAMLMAQSLSKNVGAIYEARNGATGKSLLKRHKISEPAPSIVMGLDLFFWDAGKGDCGEDFRLTTVKFIEQYKELGIPLILGRLPVGATYPKGHAFVGSRTCAQVINDFLDEACRIEKNCLIYDSKECWGGLKPGDDPSAMFVDAFHTSALGNKLCAREFVKNKTYKRLKCAE